MDIKNNDDDDGGDGDDDKKCSNYVKDWNLAWGRVWEKKPHKQEVASGFESSDPSHVVEFYSWYQYFNSMVLLKKYFGGGGGSHGLSWSVTDTVHFRFFTTDYWKLQLHMYLTSKLVFYIK